MYFNKNIIFIIFLSFIFSITECENGQADGYPCNNVDLLAWLPLSQLGNPGNANDIWGWVDPVNQDAYAILGLDTGTAFIRITDPENPIIIGYLPTHTSASLWRDIKVYDNHAFIVSEAGGHGMQVFDLNQLRNYTPPFNTVTFSETAHYGLFGNAHNIAINEDTGFAYAVGSNDCSGGLHIVNIQTPSNPTYAGCYNQDGYTHDTQCVIYNGTDTDYIGREICFSSNEDSVTITDVNDKTNPITISINGYQGSQYTHQGWLTEDHRYFLVNDELDEYYNGVTTRTYIWDLQSLENPNLFSVYDHNSENIDHNMYVEGNFLYQSHYTAGLRIQDLSDIENGSMTEVAFFDIHPNGNGTSFDGSWSNYPYFDNNIVIVSGIGDNGNVESGGLFILEFNEPAYPELSLSYDTNISETNLNAGESADYTFIISNIGEEGSVLDYEISNSPFLNPLGSDNSGNLWSSSDAEIDFNWIDISANSTIVNFVNNDEASGTIPIGFDFPFYGDNYDQCSINPNGWLGFGGDSDEWDNSEIPSPNISSAALFPFWDDLNPINDNCNQYCAGEVYYYSSPEIFIVTFDQVAHWWTNFENTSYSFQVVMYPNGEFYFNYLNFEGDFSSATIGCQNQDSSDGLLMSYNSSSLINNNFSILVSQSPEWINISNNEGSLLAGQSENSIVTLNAENLIDGLYSGYLLINTNEQDINIPVSLIVNDEFQLPGDINNDGELNVQDVIIIITEFILNDLYNGIADLNEDGDLNIQDVIILINIILN